MPSATNGEDEGGGLSLKGSVFFYPEAKIYTEKFLILPYKNAPRMPYIERLERPRHKGIDSAVNRSTTALSDPLKTIFIDNTSVPFSKIGYPKKAFPF